MMEYLGSTSQRVPAGEREDCVFSCDEALFLAARSLAEESLATPAGRSVVARHGGLTMEPLVIQYPERADAGPDGWGYATFYVFDRASGPGWCGELTFRRGSDGLGASGWILAEHGNWHDLAALARDAGLPVGGV